MATEDTIVLAAAPAIAYREYLYRPDGPFARWISDRFDVVGRPGQPSTARRSRATCSSKSRSDSTGPGRCVTLRAADPQVVAAPRRLPWASCCSGR